MTVEQLSGVTEPVNEGGLVFYKRASDTLELGGATISKIRYGFKEQKLVMITIEASGASNSDALLDSFEAAYGKGVQRNRFIKQYTWISETVIMTYSRKPGQADSAVVIGDRAFALGELKSREDKAANADL